MTRAFRGILFCLPALLRGQGVMTTFAGTDYLFPDGKPVANIGLGDVESLTVDAAGNPVFVVNNDCVVVKIQPNGTAAVIAGNGFCGLTFFQSGDGGPATAAGLSFPISAAFDPQGNLYVLSNSRVRKISAAGVISAFVGAGIGTGFAGDNGPALLAKMNSSGGICADSAGNVYFADSNNNRIRKVDTNGMITTVAGTGTGGFSGDGGQATAAQLQFPLGVALDAAGNLYIADNVNSRVRKLAKDGTISTIAQVNGATSLAFDAAGALYIGGNNVVVKMVLGTAAPVPVAGDTNNAGYSGDGGPATKALLRGRIYVAPDNKGNIFLADTGNARIRKIAGDGTITTIGGNGSYRNTGQGGPATAATIALPYGVAVDSAGVVYFSERDGHRIMRVKEGVISDFAGNGLPLFTGDNGPAINASISSPQGLAIDKNGNLFIADRDNGRIRKVTPGGIISTVAQVNNPIAMDFDAAGNLYIARAGCCVVKLDSLGRVTNFAGNGTSGDSGDGGSALNAQLMNPKGIAVDGAGNVYICDTDAKKIRKVDTQGTITTFFNGAGVLTFPTSLRMDPTGNLLVSEHIGGRIFRLTPAGVRTVFAGGGPSDQLGDGKIATQASLPIPNEMAFDPAGNLYVGDEYNYRVRVVLANPPGVDVSPKSLTFTGSSGGAPQTAAITVTGAINGLDFQTAVATPGTTVKWLSVDATSASAPRVLSVRADPLNLPQGSYQGTLTITSAATGGQSVVNVAFSVGAAQPPQLSLDKSNLSFNFPKAATLSASATLRVINAGGGTINFTATASTATGGNWLAIAPASGKATPGVPAALMVTANPTGLAPGAYSGSIKIQAGSGSSATVPAILTVSNLTFGLRLTQSGITFSAVSQGGVVPAQSFGVVNSGAGVLSWTASTSTLAGGKWLSASPASGSSNAALAAPQVTVSVNQAGLAPGVYYGQVRIDAPGAANTPQVVTIAFEVLPAGSDPGAMVQPPELVFSATAGGSNPSSQVLQLFGIGAAAKTFFAGRNATGFGVLVAPREGVLDPNRPTPVVVSPNTTGSAGTSTQTLTFQFSDGRVQPVKLTLITAPAPASGAERGAGGCTPTQLIPVLTSLGQSFTVSAGWPVALSMQVVDDCQNPLTSGSVKVSFSNGDPPKDLISLNDGTWQETWNTSRGGPSKVILHVEAANRQGTLTVSRDLEGSLSTDKDPPLFTQDSVGNAAAPVSYQPLAPGSFITIFGTRLGDDLEVAKSLPLPEKLGNTAVVIGGRAAPLYVVSPGQINAVVPYGVSMNTQHQVLVQRGNTYSQPVAVDFAPAQPQIFRVGSVNPAIIVAVKSDGTQFQVLPSAPASAGDVLVIYCAGLGPVDQNVDAGSATPFSLVNTVAPATVNIGGVDAPVFFAGLTPGFTGLYQINAQVPKGVAPGDSVPITITIAGQTSAAAMMSVK